ncbi:hypothetical protein TRV_00025 [Trichophyton verrucosum HKI 0517]|uniref:Uncharacterized protein n=1 Tax=Trichophyton verrucosum (strain HKI 0517) TaxID=663202 RepID=D4CYY8_TRIVH|nr:uncharacterized protein TRV_00025 [Trichophyton verrucosum HKI 0517]EFE45152.1 hypothetical protein TRV_00025 [Trichophyton verrucosum HKI 0517]
MQTEEQTMWMWKGNFRVGGDRLERKSKRRHPWTEYGAYFEVNPKKIVLADDLMKRGESKRYTYSVRKTPLSPLWRNGWLLIFFDPRKVISRSPFAVDMNFGPACWSSSWNREANQCPAGLGKGVVFFAADRL